MVILHLKMLLHKLQKYSGHRVDAKLCIRPALTWQQCFLLKQPLQTIISPLQLELGSHGA
jgi:hypothetical protein